MKKIFIIGLISLLFSGLSFAQPWLENLPENKSKSEITFFDYQNAFEEYWSGIDIQNGKYIDEKGQEQKAYGWKQFKRWENFWQNRVNPTTGEFPSSNAGLAYKKYVAKYGNDKSDNGNWTCLGTNTTPGGYAGIGRLSTVAFHPTNPDVFWVGAPAGGLWATTDGGSTWTVTTDNNDVLGVSAIVIPSDYDVSTTIYLGTGDRDASDNYSIGVLKSTDAGETWNSTGLVFSPADKELVNNMKILPEDDNVIFAATSAGFYITIDAGLTWTKTTSTEFVDIELCPNNSDIIYGSTRDGEIYKSIDGGENWTNVYSSGGNARVELAVTADNPAIVYAIGGNGADELYAIFKSVDYGETFSVVFDEYNLLAWGNGGGSGGQAWYDLSMAADPNNEDVVYIGGVNTWKSVDGGVSWNLANHWYGGFGADTVHADKHYLAFRNEESVLFEVNDGGVYSTPDGETWTDHTNGITISQIYGLSTAQSVDNQTIVGLQDNGTKLQDGAVWSDVLGGDGMKCLIDYTDENIQYGSFYYGQIYRTTDSWYSETDISANIPGGAAGNWVTPYVLDPIDHNTIYVGYSKLWKSQDNGNSFEEIGSFGSNLNSIAICPSNSNYIYVGKSSDIYRTSDGGGSWDNITNDLPVSEASLTYIEVKNNDPNTVWVTLSEYNEFSGVYKTTDGGETWTNISAGLPEIPVNCIIQNKLESSFEQLYVGTDFGVFLKNGDSDWQLFSSGLPNVVVSELDIYYDLLVPENSRLRASTYGRGLWESDLNLSGSYAPFVSTGAAENINFNSVDLSGEIVNDYSSDIVESGVLVSLNSSPFIGGDNVIQVATDPNVTTGIYTVNIDGLESGTTYYFRAYAENGNGVGYGNDFQFSTLCSNVTDFSWTEGAENGGNFPNCFENEIISGDNLWSVSQGNATTPSNPYSGEYNFFIKGGVASGSTRLISPIFDFEEMSEASLGFWIYSKSMFAYTDKLSVMYRSSSVDSWTNLLTIDYSIEEWTHAEVHLPNLSDEYQIAFEAELEGGRGICLDELYVGVPLGIDNVDENKVFVYPNPTSGLVYVNITDFSDNTIISVTDLAGREIKQIQVVDYNTTVDLSDYLSGVYILKINTENGVIAKKIIIE